MYSTIEEKKLFFFYIKPLKSVLKLFHFILRCISDIFRIISIFFFVCFYFQILSGAAFRCSTTATVSPLLLRRNLGRRPCRSGKPLQALCLFFLSILWLFWHFPSVLFSLQRTQDRTKGFPPHKLRLRLLYEVSHLSLKSVATHTFYRHISYP